MAVRERALLSDVALVLLQQLVRLREPERVRRRDGPVTTPQQGPVNIAQESPWLSRM